MVYNPSNSNAELRHRHVKAFLACYNHIIAQPSWDEYPNWKILPILKWMNYQYPMAWDRGKTITGDEITM